MAGTRKSRNSPLAYLRQAIVSLPADNNNASLILYLAALMIIVRNNRLKHLLVRSNIASNRLATADLKHLTKEIYSQLSSFAGQLIQHLPLPECTEAVWQTTWQSLQNKNLDILWGSETTLGYSYQFLCSPKRSQSLFNLSQSDKTIDAQTLIDFTQLYTPDFVADYLLQNTIMPLWNEKISVEKITVLDPASGAGNFLVKAFNILSRLYIQEGATEKEAGKILIKQNLFGADIDEKALAVSALALLVRSLETNALDIQPANLQSAADSNSLKGMLGSLNRQWPVDHLLSRKYRVVVTNPPYIGRKLLDRSLKQSLKVEFPNSHNDLANAFLERSIELTE
ncbi:MAG: N-6 DNA methylase, partial [Candidatus Obscuribacterales bacterium]|nr:N-6 DNA methylase [Candidatus Obscuribacterales bacterium]